MKSPNFLIPAVLLLGTACTPQLQSVMLTQTYQPPTGAVCVSAAPPATFLYSGGMNLAVNDRYLLLVTVDSAFDVIDDSNGLPIPGANVAVLTEKVLSYAVTPGPTGATTSVPASETETVNIRINPATTGNVLLVNMFGPQLQEYLKAVPVTPRTDFFTLKATLQLRGTLNSGGAVVTNTITFPIEVFRGAQTCGAGQLVVPSGPCDNAGQDGSAIACCTPVPATGLCP